MDNLRVNFSRLILGVTLAVVGVSVVLDRTSAADGAGRTLWPVLLIGFGTARLLEPRTRGPRKGLLLLSLGLWLLLVQRGVVALAESWPILLIILGVGVVLDALTSRARDPNAPRPPFDRQFDSSPLVALGIIVALVLTASSGQYRDVFQRALPDSRDGVRVVAVMGRAAHVDRSPSFRGAQVGALMGRSELDLRETSIGPGEEATINVVAVMGQAVIRVPEGWTLDTRAVPVMGEIRDQRISRGADRPAEAPASGVVPPRVVLRGAVVMGLVVIESTDAPVVGSRHLRARRHRAPNQT